jgi:hypothetical protein
METGISWRNNQEPAMTASLFRRAFVGVAIVMPIVLSIAGCSPDAVPGSAAVRKSVEAHILDLRRRFVAGDYQGMPISITEQMDDAERERIRGVVDKAQILSFGSDTFTRRDDGAWTGQVTFDVSVPVPDAPSFITSKWRATATAVIRRGTFSWEALGLLDVRVEHLSGNLERT